MHLDDELVQRLLDRELPPAAADSVRAHLDTCTDCRTRTAEAGRENVELERLLGLLDHPAPPLTVEDIAADSRPRRRQGVRWAALLLLAAGLAGVAYATPGLPLRAWISALTGRPAVTPGQRAAAPKAIQSQDSGLAGIAVPPGERFVVRFASVQDSGVVVVTLDGGATELTVRVVPGAGTFVAGPDSLTIDNRASGASYAIEIPAAAPRVEIRLAGRRIFLKDGSSVVTRAGRVPAAGPLRLPLTP